MFITFISQTNFLQKLYPHICYEKNYLHKKFSKIQQEKILITIMCTNFIYGEKNLEVKLKDNYPTYDFVDGKGYIALLVNKHDFNTRKFNQIFYCNVIHYFLFPN